MHMQERRKYAVVRESIDDVVGRLRPEQIAWWTAILVATLTIIAVVAAMLPISRTIVAPVVVETRPPTIAVRAKLPGRLFSVCVSDGDSVAAGAVLATLNGAGSLLDMVAAKSMIERTLEDMATSLDTVAARRLRLGSVALFFERWLAAVEYWSLLYAESRMTASNQHPGAMARFQVREMASDVRHSIASWESTYVIHAPSEGKVLSRGGLENSSRIFRDEIVFMIMPWDYELVGKLSVPAAAASLVEPGMKVRLRLASSKASCGIIPGRIYALSPFPDNDGSVAAIAVLDIQAVSRSCANLRPGSAGHCEIVLREGSLLSRVIEPLRNLSRRTE